MASLCKIFHGYAHMSKHKLPYIINILQTMGILLSFNHHRKHHIRGELYFSIVNGWSNGLLNYFYTFALKPIMNKYDNYFIQQY